MAGTKRPRTDSLHGQSVTKQVTPHADANTPELIEVPATPTAPYAFTTATDNRFDTLDLIRVNTLGGSSGEASLFSTIDKSLGFYDLNFKSIAVSGDLELTETPTSVLLSLKQPEVVPTFIQSGTNLTQSGGLIYKGTNGDVLEFRTIGVGPGLTLQQTATQVVLGLATAPATGDISGAINLGSGGANVFHSKDGSNLQFRSLISANSIISLNQNSADTQIVISFNEAAISLANLGGVLPANRVSGLSPIATNPDYNLLNNKPVIPARLTDLQDVSGTPTQGDTLTYMSGTGWVPSAPGLQNAFNRVTVGTTSINAAPGAMDLKFEAGDGLVVNAASGTRTLTYGMRKTGVTAGSYLNANIVIDEYGRILTAGNGSSGSENGFPDPMTSIGDMIYRNSANQTTRLKGGSNGQVLTMDFGVPTWRNPATGGGGSVSSVNILGSGGIEATGGPITSSGVINVSLKATGVAAGTYTAATIRVDAQGRITMASNNTIVSGARKINTGYGLDGGGDLTNDLTLSLQKSGAIAGTYSNPTVRVDEYGRILQISGGGAGGGGGVTSVNAVGQNGINITGAPITSSGTLTVTLTNTGVQAGQYSNPTIQVNAQGRITSISSGGGGGGDDFVLGGNMVAGATGEPIANSFGGLFLPIVPLAALQNRTHAVNTNKDQGMMVNCFERNWIYVASGDGPTNPWVSLGYYQSSPTTFAPHVFLQGTPLISVITPG